LDDYRCIVLKIELRKEGSYKVSKKTWETPFYKGKKFKPGEDVFNTIERLISKYEPGLGRSTMGITKKISVTLAQEDWKEIQNSIAEGKYKSISHYFRESHGVLSNRDLGATVATSTVTSHQVLSNSYPECLPDTIDLED
jgi:hypothetical protein